jgi:hypothetical protein
VVEGKALRGLPGSETQSCIGTEQRLERIATAFDRKRYRLIGSVTNCAGKIPKEND